MAKKNVELVLSENQAELVKASVTERKAKLEKIVTNLMKERQIEAVKPILAQIDGLSEVEAALNGDNE